MFILQVALAILPCILIIFLIYRADRYEKEAIFPLVLCFLLGILITFPLFELQALFDRLGIARNSTILMTIFYSFILISLTEETLKYAVLRIYPYRQSFFNEPIDGIVYAMMIGMGFAMLENVFYAYQFEMTTTVLRGFTAVPAHACFAAIMGFFVGKARFAKEAKKRKRFLLLGWLVPIGVHGLYDFFIIQQIYDGLIVLALITLGAAIFFSIKLIKEQQANSPFEPAAAQESNQNIEPASLADDTEET
ncbi:MAG: PrsW family glutamic-type intramembrane protease [Bacteroidota bacterium]